MTTSRTRFEPQIRVTRSGGGSRRSVEAELEIHSPVEAVWRALTDAAELENWFPPAACVEEGAGGSIELIRDDQMKTRMPIEIWEPGYG
jgi:uncharacterized protein YndB with AHSA1/START domain